ncbi:unnamed protein product [Rotaria sordida]|uniref:BSD domain-containing protein n=1 Tax=Rotaria sordida TaxID=392033 RepID=A0A818LX70_9BILA|nr:unnamed protein product [Rotaria sordida]
MNTNTEQEKPIVELPSTVSTETENPPLASSSTTTGDNTTNQAPVVEEQHSSSSSWFNNFGLPSNLTNQLTNLSSSIMQVTSKVGEVANTLVHKTLPQRPLSPIENQQTDITKKDEDEEQTSEESTGIAGINKDLTSIFNDLSSTVKKGAQQLKHAVEETSLLGDFSKEHEKFVTEKRTQQRREEAAVPPWVGYVEEEEMKKQILALSKEKRNFLRSPPPGANFHFDMTALYPVALATLDVDENLKQMRFDLVPKQINEEAFWRNYFYRVSLIKQSTQLSALAHEKANTSSTDDTHGASDARNRTASDSQDKTHDANQEFVSEDYDASAVSMDDIRREIEQLTVTKPNSNKTNQTRGGSSDDNEWDKALADELDNVSAEELEAQINQMLAVSNAKEHPKRSKSVDAARLRRRQQKDIQKNHLELNSLEEYGYHFENGKLVSIIDGKPFEFHVHSNNDDNRVRYNAIGRLVTNYIYDLLEEKECGLQRIKIPLDAKKSEPTGFFFASEDFDTAEYLMIIIHGSGVVRAGQWSRSLIINEDLAAGSQLDYIKQARINHYAVIVTNTNLNTDESSESILNIPQRIRGSGSAEEHACYIWEKFVRRCRARHICIMAHSYGGAVVLELASKYMSDFDKRVFAIALTDSPMRTYTKHFNKNVSAILKKKTINWIADHHTVNTILTVGDYGIIRSAGHLLHEWTSYTAFQCIFKFFEDERKKLSTT